MVFDHHCSVLGNCIGGRNYKYFCMFVGNLIANFAIFVVNLAVYLLGRAGGGVSQAAAIVVVAVIGGVVGVPILGFALFHLYLCLAGRTTR